MATLTENRPDSRRIVVVLTTGVLLLTVFYYFGRPAFYNTSGLPDWFEARIGGRLAEYPGVLAYAYWGVTSIVLRVLVPLGIVVWVIGARPAEFGFRIRGVMVHAWPYLAAYVAMVPVLLWASSLDTFESYYPFYRQAAEGGLAFWVYESGYALQFLGVEAFFRGFLLFGLAPVVGRWPAIAVMVVPYTMIHFGKPMPEAFAAIVAGFLLGWLALRSRSFVPGVFLHVAVAVTMDLLVIWRIS
ncbi:MAG: CPBP family intramembrane metalloprotease [Acidimicrobiia bacterium]|nr:CPBP family intramembrane metalloprotease [Acidimicrobiia bacterium]NNC75101.1 CPBP family intramembrane metalloprotease [Acidimicrobiia bacterium]